MIRFNQYVSLAALSLFLANACTIVHGQETPELDVPYVPTPEPVVQRMLELAQVKEGDVVYDLGCGDGRIVIAAVRDRGAARGVGVDIDPQRIKESKENAQRAGVADKVEFREQDLFEMDLSEANVITMYLLSSVNMKLRPKLLELKPGTRVVSHAFDMDDWEPDAHAQVEQSGGQNVYFWIVPAKVQGKWTWEADTPEGKEPVMVELDQQFQKVSGTAKVGEREYTLADAKLKGDQLSFTLKVADPNAQATALRYEGKVKGDQITGRTLAGAGNRSDHDAQPAAARQGENRGENAEPSNQASWSDWTARRESD